MEINNKTLWIMIAVIIALAIWTLWLYGQIDYYKELTEYLSQNNKCDILGVK